MAYQFTKKHIEVMTELKQIVAHKLPKAQVALVQEFIEHYYAMVADDDLTSRSIDDLYGAVVSHWNFLYQREPHECKVRVFNPRYEQHGWQSRHTVVEVVQTDMPFLVDSTRMELQRQGLLIHLVIQPGAIRVKRDKAGQIVGLKGAQLAEEPGFQAEATIYIEIDEQPDEAKLMELQSDLMRVLDDVRVVVEDWKPMRQQTEQLADELAKQTAVLKEHAELVETLDFLRWIAADNFTFLGVCDYALDSNKVWQVLPKSGLGLLRAEHLQQALLSFANPEDQLIVIQQLTVHSPVHRSSEPYCISVKRYDENGQVVGERRLVGLYTSVAYYSRPAQIPFLRRKVQSVLEKSGLASYGHAWKTLANILETFPRDELFQASDSELFEIAMGIFHMQERSRIRLFIRKDAYCRFYSALVYVPREQFNSRLTERMGSILANALSGTEIHASTAFLDASVARVHYMIRLPNQQMASDLTEQQVSDLGAKLILAGRTWRDDLHDALFDYYGEAQANKLFRKYRDAFPASYRESCSARMAVSDLEHLEALTKENPLGMRFYQPLEGNETELHLKLFCLSEPMPLSDVLPMLENMGLRVIAESSHILQVGSGETIWISDFTMQQQQGRAVDVDAVQANFQETFAQIWTDDIESDGFNGLILTAGLTGREVMVLRGCAKYLKQVGFTFSQSYIEETLGKYPHLAVGLIRLFHLRFNPKEQTAQIPHPAIQQQKEELLNSLNDVDSLDEDRILRRYIDVIMAMLRTNFYQLDKQGHIKSYISYKLNPKLIPELPLPLPMFEIFVHSARVEGVHLRAAQVARGGIRWSDRREDFRTEILDLMKAQQVKNVVIVPAGAKGGFIPKRLPSNGSRDEIMQEVIAAYSIFIRGLLDLTDNRVGTDIVPPEQVVRHDADDVYLVVAADKGTATFSDIANKISVEYGFWLGDAFASGGSAGYDHKKIGITARGAWESVKRHFRELGRDIQTSDVSVVGVGDMSGDVFGNGLLLSQHIRLIGAFNHQHIFLDPNPDTVMSFAERQRLFNLPRSTWNDYNTALISEGGGIFSRSAKSIKLSAPMQAVLQITADEIVPNELIRALLKAPVDLLWNGGIGTYVKASQERSMDVGDKTNDMVRINGKELRCLVIGEGGNLGMTQLGRVEYSLAGGICFTDFIDNVGGVDCSDHEVNIKILLDTIVANGDLTEKQRNALLVEMTDEVGKLVITDCYRQTQSLSWAASRSSSTLDEYQRFIATLERLGQLDRDLANLPSDVQMAERKNKGQGLTRPELCMVMAYSKILLKEQLLASSVPEDLYLRKELGSAFPARLTELFATQMGQHRLNREIIATQIANMVNNEMGATFIQRLFDETGASASDVVRAFMAARKVFDMGEYWRAIEALDNKVNSAVQLQMMTELVRLLRRVTRWFLRNRRQMDDIGAIVSQFSTKIKELRSALPNVLVGSELEKVNEVVESYVSVGVPTELAWGIATASPMVSALDIIEAANMHKRDIQEFAQAYFALGSELQLDWFRSEISHHPVTSNWDALARAACKDDLDRQQRTLTEGVLRYKKHDKANIEESLASWGEEQKVLVERWFYMMVDLKTTKIRQFTMFAVALRELVDLAQSSLMKKT